ncbi:hypothetical protein BC835DRAFT_1305130 [Cytidiella melzeri]|nr:hypothetical protein BC835DRAFT_1305130 [Cytidiella melzeri]
MMFSFMSFPFALLALAGLLKAFPIHYADRSYASVIWTDEGPGTCGTTTAPADCFVVLPPGEFDSDKCGKTVKVKNWDNDAKVEVIVVGKCPDCVLENLGLSYQVFQDLGGILKDLGGDINQPISVQWDYHHFL